MKLKPLKDFTIKSYLTQNLHIAEKDADICAAFARGNLGKAIHLASSDEFRELFQKVMVLVNLKPAKLAGVLSEGMLLCAEDAEGNLSLMTPEKDMPAGAEIC